MFLTVTHPAVQILALLRLPHPLDVGGKDGEKSREHSITLGPARVFREQTVHDGGTLNDEPGNVLQENKKCQDCFVKTKEVN